MYTFLFIIQTLSVIFSFVFICFVARENSFNNNKYLFIALICSFIQSVGLCLEFLSPNQETALMAVKLQYIGSCFSTSTLLFFVFDLCESKVKRPFYWIVIGLDCLLLVSILTAEWHNLFFNSISYTQEPFYNHIEYTKGILYYVFTILRLLLSAYMVKVTLLNYMRFEDRETSKDLFICISAGIPTFFVFIESLEIPEMPDFTALGLAVSCILFVIIVYKYHVFNIAQSAKETIIKNMIEAIIIVDQNFKYIESNISAKSIFPRLKYMKRGDSIRRCSAMVNEIFRKGGKSDFEYQEKFYECHISQILDGNEIKSYTACIFDVTDSRYYMKQLIQMKEQSDAANRAKSDFLANMSHEIRTPMNAIIGLSEIVLRGELNEDQRGNIRSILTSSKSLLSIINNILDLSKIESGKFEIIDEEYNMGTVLHDVYNIINVRLYDKPINFEINIPDDLPSVYNGDYIRIKEILCNILGNAVKFTKEGFIRLDIDWKLNEKDDSIVNLKMKVTDSGIGIKKDDIKKLFKTYNQVDTRKNRSISGTGLGLAISKNLAEMMGGYISVESVYGKGSVFTIGIKQKVVNFEHINKDLVFKDNDGEFNEENNSFLNEKIVPIAQARVLIVDDVSVNLQVSKGLMEPYNMKVDVALNGTEAIKMIKERDYDLVFMDHMMPNMDGVDVTRIIRSLDDEKYKKLPIIALTANALTSSRDFFLKNGFNGFLAKPIDLKQLNKVLYDYLPVKNVVAEQIEKTNSDTGVSIKGIDSSIGFKNVGGRKESYYKILKTYLRETTEMYQKFDELVANDIDTFKIKIHGLKSSSANIGAVFISEKARLLEMASKDYDMAYIKENLPPFYKELKELLSNIESSINDYEKSKNKDVKDIKNSIDIKKLNLIKEAANNFDITTMETIMEEISKQAYNEEISELIENIETTIDNFEYDKCIELINDYEKNLKK